MTLCSGDLANPLGYRSNNLVDGSDVSVLWQAHEGTGEVDARVAVYELDEHLVKDVTSKFLDSSAKQAAHSS
jgi:hypothetical protein